MIIPRQVIILVLLRSFKFTARDGHNTEYATRSRLIPHPVVSGESGSRIPMRVHLL